MLNYKTLQMKCKFLTPRRVRAISICTSTSRLDYYLQRAYDLYPSTITAREMYDSVRLIKDRKQVIVRYNALMSSVSDFVNIYPEFISINFNNQ